jgi:hypothetical protein
LSWRVETSEKSAKFSTVAAVAEEAAARETTARSFFIAKEQGDRNVF